MLYISKVFHVAATAALLSQVIAHPGHDLTEEIAERNNFFKFSKRDLSHCDAALRRRGIEHSQQERRHAAIEKARAARGFPRSQYKFLDIVRSELMRYQNVML
jgi:adenylate cyclase class IV